MSHRNAPTTERGRLLFCQRMEAGTPISHVAAGMGISRQCISKWWHRYVEFGPDGLRDRSMLGSFFPRSDVEILDTWHTVGMRGTGSADIAVHDVFVPNHRTFVVGPLTHPAPGFEGPLYRMLPWPGIVGEATVSVGVAAAQASSKRHSPAHEPAILDTASRVIRTRFQDGR